MRTLNWRLYKKGEDLPSLSGQHVTSERQTGDIIKEIEKMYNVDFADYHKIFIQFT